MHASYTTDYSIYNSESPPVSNTFLPVRGVFIYVRSICVWIRCLVSLMIFFIKIINSVKKIRHKR